MEENNISSKLNSEKNRWEVELKGEFDIFNAQSLKNEILKLIENKPLDLLIRCDALQYLDSTAIGALVAVHRNVQSYEGKVILHNVKPNMRKLFKITNLDKVFEIEVEENE